MAIQYASSTEFKTIMLFKYAGNFHIHKKLVHGFYMLSQTILTTSVFLPLVETQMN